jgi:Xanthomonas XOO_2897-like deaminase
MLYNVFMSYLSELQFNNLLTQPPYWDQAKKRETLPSPTDGEISTISFKTLRKKSLDEQGIPNTPSPLKKMRKLDSEHPLVKKALEFQQTNDITAGRNVAITVFNSPRSKSLQYVISATSGPPGAPHSELKVLDEVPPHIKMDISNIKAIFTQRKPCKGCTRKLDLLDKENTEVMWEAHHTPHKKRQRKNEELYQKIQNSRGIRVANPKVRKSLSFATSTGMR